MRSSLESSEEARARKSVMELLRLESEVLKSDIPDFRAGATR